MGCNNFSIYEPCLSKLCGFFFWTLNSFLLSIEDLLYSWYSLFQRWLDFLFIEKWRFYFACKVNSYFCRQFKEFCYSNPVMYLYIHLTYHIPLARPSHREDRTISKQAFAMRCRIVCGCSFMCIIIFTFTHIWKKTRHNKDSFL